MTLTEQRDITATDTRSRYAMGELTVAKEGDDWIVLEDGHRVGGTLRYPFASREDAERWIKRELAGYADPDAERDAKAKIIRETDPEIWARFEEVYDKINRSQLGKGEDFAAMVGRPPRRWNLGGERSAVF